MDRKITETQNYFYTGFDKRSNKMNIQTIEGFKGAVIQFISKGREIFGKRQERMGK